MPLGGARMEPCLQRFDASNGVTALLVHFGKIAKRGRRVHAPCAQFFLHKGQIRPHKP